MVKKIDCRLKKNKGLSKCKSKVRKFKAKIYGETQFGKTFNRTVIVKGKNARKVYSELKNKNDVIDIESFREIK